MREVHIQPKSKPTGLHNYLPEPFTFFWAKEEYGPIAPGETLTLPEWQATHAAIKMAERWFVLNPTNVSSTDPKIKGYFSRHDENFQQKVREALIYPKGRDTAEVTPEKATVMMMNSDAPKQPERKTIELPEDEEEVITGGCSVCKATGPRHKPTCSKFKPHEKDVSQAAKLKEAASRA